MAKTKRATAPARPAGPPAQVIQLARSQQLVIERARPLPPPARTGDRGDCVRLLDARGHTSLTIRVTERGTVIELGGGPVALHAAGDLAISARNLMLHGRDSVAISSDESLRVEARRQEITATHGDVKVYANDDVKIDGERIRMNC